MILDTSALMAILAKEADAPRFIEAISGSADGIALSAATLVEATMVAEGRGGPALGLQLDSLLRRIGAEIVPVGAREAETAREGWRRYGKGRHKAGLNLGDCFAYALAKERDETLLFKGEDFAQTDVKRAL